MTKRNCDPIHQTIKRILMAIPVAKQLELREIRNGDFSINLMDLENAINELTKTQRDDMIAVYVLGKSCKEHAYETGRSSGSVSGNCRAGVRHLAMLLGLAPDTKRSKKTTSKMPTANDPDIYKMKRIVQTLSLVAEFNIPTFGERTTPLTKQDVLDAIEELPSTQREVLLLIASGMTNAQVAVALGKSANVANTLAIGTNNLCLLLGVKKRQQSPGSGYYKLPDILFK